MVRLLVSSETKRFGVKIHLSNKGLLEWKSCVWHQCSGQLATTELLPLLCANMLPPRETAGMLLEKRSGEDIIHLVFCAKLD